MPSIVGDRYVIERELGSGAAACVYLAHDQRLERAVAVKVLREELARALGHQRFLREIKFASGLRHPNLVPLLDYGETDGQLWYVMPFVDGGTLRQRLAKESQLKVEQTIRWGADIADALAHAHTQGIVHRDVKPENILLDGDHALLADFGIARGIDAATIDTLTSAGIAVGTPAYMSPEQATGATDVDGRSDVYSLSCVLYECLAGIPPFVGATPQSVIAQRFAHAPHAVSSYRTSTPPMVEQLINAGMSIVPADRIGANELARGLRALATGESSIPMRVSAGAPAVSNRAKRPWRVLAAGAGAVLLGAIAWWLTPTRSLELDADKVVLFPITVKGIRDTAMLAAGVPGSIAAELQSVPPLRWVEGENLLRETGTAQVSQPHAQRIRAARNAGAAHFIDGELSVFGDSGTLVLRLVDSAADSVVSRSQATLQGGAETAKQLALLAVGELLPPLLDAGHAIDVRVLAGRRPRAIALFLLGERQFRQSRYATALAQYQLALGLDSNLAMAALNAARSARSLFNEADARRFVALAIARDSMLPGANADFARGLSWMYSHSADSALFYLQRATGRAPEWGELQSTLGDVHFYVGLDGTDSDSAATDRYRRARELDPTFTPTLYHLAWLALRRGDAAMARRYLAEYQRGGSHDTAFVRAITVGADCQSRGPASVDWTLLATTTAAAVITLGQNLVKSGADLVCSKAAFRAVFNTEGAL
ncbi:MAG: serine/threonine-protein kinase, partial [Gemmatimonas sp.]